MRARVRCEHAVARVRVRMSVHLRHGCGWARLWFGTLAAVQLGSAAARLRFVPAVVRLWFGMVTAGLGSAHSLAQLGCNSAAARLSYGLADVQLSCSSAAV
mmetsp:Transcript_13357/g.28851  ORF Transcript_13357/g.28851 Transcript_13357/m.28851 type:complete len:101 (-) Transcript_13357:84-386(-)